MPRVLVLGGGFGGLAAARGLLRSGKTEVQLVDRHNYAVFSPLLAEVATGTVNANHAVVPLRAYLRPARPLRADVDGVDLDRNEVHVRYGGGRGRTLEYDELVLALGSETDFFGIEGLEEHALTLDTVGDALALRARILDALEQAEVEHDEKRRRALLTFVIGGGAFTGVEIAGALADYLRRALPSYPGVHPGEPRVALVEMKNRLLPELPAPLGQAALHELTRRGVAVRLAAAIDSLLDDELTLADGRVLRSHTVVWAGGVRAVPVLEDLPFETDDRGRIPVDETLRVRGHDHVWAVGDCAAVPDGRGGTHPPTAQHALREGRHVAANVARTLAGAPPEPFRYTAAGMLVALGERRGIGEIRGRHVSGLSAWLLWRGFYLARLPTGGRRMRVALDWLFSAAGGPALVELPLYSRVAPGEQRATERAAGAR